MARPFNIWLYPHSDNHIDPHGDSNRILSMHPAAIKFNLRCGFNFNKLYRMGVNYRNLSTDKEVIRRLCEHRVVAQMAHEKATGVERRQHRKFEPPESSDSRLVLGSEKKEGDEREAEAALMEEVEKVKDFVGNGEDLYSKKFESLIFTRCLSNYLKDNEVVNLKEYKLSVVKKEKKLIIQKNVKVQKVQEGDAANK